VPRPLIGRTPTRWRGHWRRHRHLRASVARLYGQHAEASPGALWASQGGPARRGRASSQRLGQSDFPALCSKRHSRRLDLLTTW